MIALDGTDEPILETLSEIYTPWRTRSYARPDSLLQPRKYDYRLTALFGKAKNAHPPCSVAHNGYNSRPSSYGVTAKSTALACDVSDH
jgi:hypothetical protein